MLIRSRQAVGESLVKYYLVLGKNLTLLKKQQGTITRG